MDGMHADAMAMMVIALDVRDADRMATMVTRCMDEWVALRANGTRCIPSKGIGLYGIGFTGVPNPGLEGANSPGFRGGNPWG